MKTRNLLISAILLSCVFFIGCNEEKDINNEFVPQTITPIQIAQGELHGAGSERVIKQNLVINTREEWSNLIETMSFRNNENTLTEAEIDFSTDLVIAVFDEVLSMGGRSIDITNVAEYPDSIVVSVQNLKKGDDSRVFTQPYHIVKIPVADKKIVFQQEDNNESEEIPFTEYLSPEPPLCRWAPFDAIPGELVIKSVIINSNEELEKYIGCSGGSYPAVDFSKHTLLLTCGRSGTIRKVSGDLFKEGTGKYTLKLFVTWVQLVPGLPEWHFAILTPKIADEATITLGFRY